MNIFFQYPAWYVLPCLLLGAAYAGLLYYFDKEYRAISPWLNRALAALRFLLASLLAILLLSPLIKSATSDVKKPIIVFAQDVSESVGHGIGKDTLRYREAVQRLTQAMGEKFEVQSYSFGNEVRQPIDFKYNDKVSNCSELLDELYDVYANQNLGAVILATDGIYNEGSNPMYASTKLNVPIYSIALGDTTKRRDVSIKKVYSNRIVYLNDKFTVEVDVAAQNCKGERLSLTVSKVTEGRVSLLQTLPITPDATDFFVSKQLVLDANEVGVQQYRIGVTQVSNEVTTVNNTKDIFVEVLDVRQKILILANAPHADLSAMKQALEANKNYDITIAFANDLKKNVADFDFLILHQLPSAQNQIADVLKTMNDQRKPRLFVLGAQSNLNTLAQAQSLLKISGDGRNTNEVQPIVGSQFNFFVVEPELAQRINKFPPVVAPFGEYSTSPEAQVLLKQKVGSVPTEYPLLLIANQQGLRTGILCGENTWKWRFFSFLQYQNYDAFDQLLQKTVQYLTIKEDKRKFRVNLLKNLFDENEQISFDAELYNESYELINESEVKLTLRNSDGKDFNYIFNKSGKAYTLNVGYLPVGNYTYTATTQDNGKELSFAGKFTVQAVQLEMAEITADHQLLRLLAKQLGGEVVSPDSISTLNIKIASKNSIKPVVYSTTRTRPVIHQKWIFFALLSLLGLEWFFRKYFGGY
jgi:hypothetical protein